MMEQLYGLIVLLFVATATSLGVVIAGAILFSVVAWGFEAYDRIKGRRIRNV